MCEDLYSIHKFRTTVTGVTLSGYEAGREHFLFTATVDAPLNPRGDELI